MAQLKSTVVAGSLRVTDTTYTNDLMISAMKEPHMTLIGPSSGSTNAAPIWRKLEAADIASGTLPIERGGTGKTTAADAWTNLGGGASGKHADTFFVKAISSTDNNIPRFDGSGGQIQSSRMSINDDGLITLSYNGQYPGDTQYSNAAGQVGEFWLDTGHATNVTSPRFYWRVRRPQATATTTTGTNYEQFRLPAATAGTAASATYEILTTKSTITVAQGGTGATSFTSGNLLIGNGTNAVGTRAIKNMTALGDLGWTAATTDIYIPTVNTLAYWNGRYNSSTSNLTYCNQGAFGNMAIKTKGDGFSDSSNTLSVAYGTAAKTALQGNQTLFKLNNADKTAASAASFFAPTQGGTAEQILIGGGSNAAPVWSEAMSLYGSNVNTWSAKFNGKMIGNSAHNYGTALPTSGEAGQIFFQLSDPVYELPLTGDAGAFLKKVSADTRTAQWSNWTIGEVWSASSDPYNGTAPNYDATNAYSRVGVKNNYGIVAMYATASSAGIKTQKGSNASRFFHKVDDTGAWTYSDFFIVPHTTNKGTQPSSSQTRRFNFSSPTISSGTDYQDKNTIGKVESVIQSDNTTYMGLSTFENVADSTNQAYFRVNYAYTGVKMSTTNCKIYGAVWNDYAEFRRDNQYEKGKQKPGNCVVETGTGTLALSTMRLQRGAEIITDTFGFAIGQDDNHNANTPVAVSGRVLAYPYESREEFRKNIGKPVCSGPNGTVSIMTQFEERTYPSRIIGTISEVPTYKEWGEDNIKVDGRVWIRMR